MIVFTLDDLLSIVTIAVGIVLAIVAGCAGGIEMKAKAIWQSFNSHDCETYYRCPVCNNLFGDWLLFLQEPNENGTKDYCPHCKTELEVQRL